MVILHYCGYKRIIVYNVEPIANYDSLECLCNVKVLKNMFASVS